MPEKVSLWLRLWARVSRSPGRLATETNDREQAFIHARQVDTLYEAFLPGAVGTLLISAIFALAMWDIASHWWLSFWVAGMYGVVGLRLAIAFLYRKKRNTEAGASPVQWENRFAWGGVAGGVLWGAVSILFIPGNDAVAMSMIIVTIAGVSATGAALMASSQRSLIPFLVTTLLPLSVTLYSFGYKAYNYMAAAIVIYMLVLLQAASRRQMLLIRSIRMGIENERLLGAIAAEKMLAEERTKSAAQLAVFETELQYREIFENITDGLILVDVDQDERFTVARLNPAFRRMMGMVRDAVEGVFIERLLEKPVADEWLQPLQQCFHTGQAIRTELIHTLSGSTRVLDVAIIPIAPPTGRVHRLIGIARDMTERKQMETLLYEREQAFRLVVENSPDVIVRYDTQCRRIFSNSTHQRLSRRPVQLGVTPLEDWQFPTGLDEASRYQDLLMTALFTGQVQECELRGIHERGEVMCHLVHIVPEFDSAGNVNSVLTFGRDISERVRLEEEMRRQASYDALTGLPNRRMFHDRLCEEVAKSGRTSQRLAMLFIDLDRFKEINDTLGHETGDEVLRITAERIQDCMRESDLLARLGGDEFVALLPEIPDMALLGRIAQQIIERISAPYELPSQSLYLSASIGVAGYPDDAAAPEALLASADQAMYAAKQAGKNTFRFFTQEIQTQAHVRMRLSQDLRTALSEGQLEAHFQPIFTRGSVRMSKAELLLRWRHPELGWVSPADFIPVAEETGLIHEIGDWVFRQAASMVSEWRACQRHAGSDLRPCQVSVNISPRQFAKVGVEDLWIKHLQEMAVDPSDVVLEITEGLLLNEQFDVSARLCKLQAAGIQIALDDFGTGYSAMAYLKRFNINYLKIDQSFIRDLGRDANDRAIVEAIVLMARRLGIETIAEGVETAEQQDALAEMGCANFQGYLYGRPVPPDTFLEYVRQGEARTKMLLH